METSASKSPLQLHHGILALQDNDYGCFSSRNRRHPVPARKRKHVRPSAPRETCVSPQLSMAMVVKMSS